MPQKQTPYQEPSIENQGLVPQDSGLSPETDLIQKYIRGPLYQSGPGRAALVGSKNITDVGEKAGFSGNIGDIDVPGKGLGGILEHAATFAGGSPALRKVFDYFVERYPRIMDKYVGFVGENPLLKNVIPASNALPEGRSLAVTTPPGLTFSDLHEMRIPKGIKSDIMFDPQAAEIATRGPFESFAGLGEEEKLARIMGHEVTHAVQYGRPDITYSRLTSRTAPAIPPRPSTGMLSPEYRQSMGNVMNELEVPAYVAEGGILKNYQKRVDKLAEQKHKSFKDVYERLKETSERLEKLGVRSPIKKSRTLEDINRDFQENQKAFGETLQQFKESLQSTKDIINHHK